MRKEKLITKDFIKNYNKIITKSDNSIITETQWQKDGDFFEKFSTYDDTYYHVPTLGNTTLV